jgi:hypothetical protein
MAPRRRIPTLRGRGYHIVGVLFQASTKRPGEERMRKIMRKRKRGRTLKGTTGTGRTWKIAAVVGGGVEARVEDVDWVGYSS